MNDYDELVDMFGNHHVSQQQPPALHYLQQVHVAGQQHASSQQANALEQEQVQQAQHVQPIPKPITYISQHYHHPTYVVPKPVSAPSLDSTVAFVLRNHGVDASTLSSAQLTLFEQGTTPQKMRLVELWRVCPPEVGGHAIGMDVYPQTSYEKEEELCRLRYETRIMAEAHVPASQSSQSMDGGDDMMSDSEVSNAPVTPVLGQDGRWDQTNHVEPYMMSGYEALAAREYENSMQSGSGYVGSTDPVYKSIADIHHYPDINLQVVNSSQGWCGQGDDDMML